MYANHRSTAYSGNTAMNASNASANGPAMSARAVSAAHINSNAADSTPSPNTAIPTTGSECTPATRNTTAGAAPPRPPRAAER
ncbi:hypothetical protein ACFQ0T_27685 [Kitasatospora gansuensis]